jgi:hypothetical protein
MRARITNRLVDALKPTGTVYYVFDTDTIGFAVRVRRPAARLGDALRQGETIGPPYGVDETKGCAKFAYPLGVHRLRARSHLLARQQDWQKADLFERGGARRPLELPHLEGNPRIIPGERTGQPRVEGVFGARPNVLASRPKPIG